MTKIENIQTRLLFTIASGIAILVPNDQARDAAATAIKAILSEFEELGPPDEEGSHDEI